MRTQNSILIYTFTLTINTYSKSYFALQISIQPTCSYKIMLVFIPLEIELHIEGSIVQEFITKPMLVDGR